MDLCQFPFKKVHTAIIVEGSASSILFVFEVFVLLRAYIFKVSKKLTVIIFLFTLQTSITIADIYFRNLNYKQCVEQ